MIIIILAVTVAVGCAAYLLISSSDPGGPPSRPGPGTGGPVTSIRFCFYTSKRGYFTGGYCHTCNRHHG